MKLLPIIVLLVIGKVSTAPLHAQYNKNSFQKKNTNTNPDLLMVKIWSDWSVCAEYPDQMQVRHTNANSKGTLTLEIKNIGQGRIEAEFTANECPAGQKDVSGYKFAKIEPGQSVKLEFSTGGCGGTVSWWFRNFDVFGIWQEIPLANGVVSVHYVKESRDRIAMEVRNNGWTGIEGEFTANTCSPEQKEISGYQKVVLRGNDVATLYFKTGGCNGAVNVWCQNLFIWEKLEFTSIKIPVWHKEYGGTTSQEWLQMEVQAILRGEEITLQIQNNHDFYLKGEFTANFCPYDNAKALNGWNYREIPPGETAFIKIRDRSRDCSGDPQKNGWKFWFRNLSQKR